MAVVKPQGAGPRRHGRRERPDQAETRLNRSFGLLRSSRGAARGTHPPALHRRAHRPRGHRGGHRRARAAEEGGPRVQGLLPVPQREDPLLLGEPGQAVLPLLRLRQARHRARLSHGPRPPGLPRGGRGARHAARASACRTRAAPTPARAARDEPLYELMARVARFYAENARARARGRATTSRGADSRPRPSSASLSATRRDSWNELLRRFGAQDAGRKLLAMPGSSSSASAARCATASVTTIASATASCSRSAMRAAA